jgi:RHH-type proline utilization regulon transcriptional repressor/proline dehydrogenase/delta 1-pyrroline-5-carboxylate dehydrogenase
MLFNYPQTPCSATRQKIRDFYRADEINVVNYLLPLAETGVRTRTRTWERARQLIIEIRKQQHGKGGVDALLQEFAISTEEGIVLMCLAEALLRVPDKKTADDLIRDKLKDGDWLSHIGNSGSMFVNASSWGLLLTGKIVNYRDKNKVNQFGALKRVVGRLGEPTIRQAVKRSMELLGAQFVMGVNIKKALKRARANEQKGYTYSYDMLGEGARTMADADRYFATYLKAIEEIGTLAKDQGPRKSPGISIKLSSIHPRYEFSHFERVQTELLPRLKTLALAAKKYDISLMIDAEEADRLEISLEVIKTIFSDPDLADWQGFGMVVQAYQKRAIFVIDWIAELSKQVGKSMMVRLVKGAYWDSEIKETQAEGYEDFPVFTRKYSSDVSYQACAKKLLNLREFTYPQFASHNAYTVATILEIDRETDHYTNMGEKHCGFEFQRLHGMGESLFDQILQREKVPCRIYAPVGSHVDLLAYLVRRLLENGANSSFVNNIVDDKVPVETLLTDPLEEIMRTRNRRNPQIAKSSELFGESRQNSKGVDLTDVNHLRNMQLNLENWQRANQLHPIENLESDQRIKIVNPANHKNLLASVEKDSPIAMLEKLEAAQSAFSTWSSMGVNQRAEFLVKLADNLQHYQDELIAICIKEAGKTPADSVAEVREAVDFCRYYAANAIQLMTHNAIVPRGVVLCISPWNFPLAIFLGQVVAALVCGNTVIAKPAEQTLLIAQRALELMRQSGLPYGVVSLVKAYGPEVGEVLVPDDRVKAVMFTGSTQVGNWLAKTLAMRGGDPIPLIAETGGQNCMIVDSTALPEQVVDDVISSGFQSAGQRCSALRVLFLQEEIAESVIEMIIGAMKELTVGDPALLSTDVGPVIDQKALNRLEEHVQAMTNSASLLYQCELSETASSDGTYFAPRLYEIADLSILKSEVFGPCIHIIRYKNNQLDAVLKAIIDTQFGLTMGIHSRIKEKTEYVAARSPAGNVYVNRNIIGAVVGIQPFGGRGLSGTGPKAGGPNYLSRLVKDKEKEKENLVNLSPSQMAYKESQATAIEASHSSLAFLHKNRILSAAYEWRYEPSANRISVARQLLAKIADNDVLLDSFGLQDEAISGIRQLLWHIENKLDLPRQLPGPTGESNELFYEPRGLLLSLFDKQSTLENWLASALTAISAGNTLIVIVEDSAFSVVTKMIEDALTDIGISDALFHVAPIGELQLLLQHPRLAGAILDPGSDWQSYMAQQLATRDGAILPLICEYDIERLFYRMVTEKTVSIDTTAAGGNTSLMTMAVEDIEEPFIFI